MHPTSKLLAVIALVAFVVALSACAPAAAPTAPAEEKPAAKETKKGYTPADEKGPTYGGILNIYGYDWPHLDPHQTLTAGYHASPGLAYGYLLRYQTGPYVTSLKVIPAMAQRWEQPNDTTYILYLNKGIKWHNIPPVNGREFTADDVVYSINRIKTPGWISAPLMEDVDKVEALDKYTVKFTLKGPSAPFLNYLANSYIKMVAKEAVEAGGGHLKNGPTIGTGPFYGAEITPKVGVKFKKVADYFEKDSAGNPLPYLDEIDAFIIPDSSTRFTALRTARLDYYSCTGQECDILKKSNPEVTIIATKSWSTTQWGLKMTKPPFNDVRVRKAVSLSVDRKTAYETIAMLPYEDGWYTYSFMMPGEDWVIPQKEFEDAWRYDPQEAKKLLAEAGYPNGFDVTLTCADYGASSITYCEFYIDALSKVGIKAKMKIVDQPTYSSHIFSGAGDFEMYSGPQGTFLEPDQWLGGYYRTGGPRNVSGINDPKLDAMIDAQRKEINPEKRKAILYDIQRYLLDKYYHLHPRTGVGRVAVWPWVGNYSTMADYPTSDRRAWYEWINQDIKKQYGKS